MTLNLWESSRKHVSEYSRREPTKNLLYQIVYKYRNSFEQEWEELFQSKHGFLRTEAIDALDKYLDCGILFHGCAFVECTNCKHSELLAFSCKQRTHSVLVVLQKEL